MQDNLNELPEDATVNSDGSVSLISFTYRAWGDCDDVGIECSSTFEALPCICDTAYGRYEANNTCFLDEGFSQWGWTNYLEVEDVYTFDLYAGAAHCDPDNGYYAGEVKVTYIDGQVTVEYNLTEGVTMNLAHVYIGCEKFSMKKDTPTVAPGQYTLITDSLDNVSNYTVGPIEVSGSVWLIAHADVCEGNSSASNDEGGSYTDDVTIECGTSTSTAPEGTVSTEETAFRISPVPFIDEVKINYTMEYNTDVLIEVYDSKGTLVKTIINNNYTRGTEETHKIDLRESINQMLYVRLTTNKETFTKKLISLGTDK